MNAPDLTIRSLLAEADHPLLSFEFFPPKDEAAFERLRRTAALLHKAHPDFATVTYGAGGSTRGRTLQVCALLRAGHYAPVMPHLTCVGSSRRELEDIADEIHRLGYRNIMTLRGDPPRGATEFQPHPDGLRYAADLVGLLKTRHPDFCCGVAGYPEKHPEAPSLEADIEQLKRKLDQGADFVTTQLFYDNRSFYAYVERCRAAGIDHPIIPGLLPAVSLKQARRITSMCEASLPSELEAQLERAGDDSDAASEVGIEWVARQVEDLLDQGVPGIHLYILNRAKSGLALSLIQKLHHHVSVAD